MIYNSKFQYLNKMFTIFQNIFAKFDFNFLLKIRMGNMEILE